MYQLRHLPDAVYVETDAAGNIVRLAGGCVNDTSAIGKHVDEFLPGQIGISIALKGEPSRFLSKRWGKRFMVHTAPILDGERVAGAIGLGIMATDTPEFLGVSEIAHALHLTESAVRKKLKRGVLPGRKIGGQWVIHHTELAEILATPG